MRVFKKLYNNKHMDKNKKILLFGGIAEGAILVFALILSIIVWTTVCNGNDYTSVEALRQANIDKNGQFIAFFQNNTTAFFCIVCVPIFVIVALDFVYFALIASKRESSLSDAQLAEIKKQAEKEVREEMMKEILAEEQGEKPVEEPAEQPVEQPSEEPEKKEE